MLNLFGKNVFARKRKAKVMPIDSVSRIETLEDRLVLAGQVASLYATNGDLTLTGSGAVDTLVVTFTANNTITLSGATIVGAGAGPFNVTGNLTINLGNGADTLSIVGGGFSLDSGNLSVDLGSGDDAMTTSGAQTYTGNVSVVGGTGVDSITLGAAGAAFTAFDVSVDSGTDLTGNVQNKTITLNAVTAHNVTLVNAGTGAQLVTLGTGAANSFTGNLKVSQTALGATSHTVTAAATTVTGNVSITNADALTNVVGWTSSNVGGTTAIVNGNATTTLNSVTITTSTLSGSVTVKNGSANTTNAITVSGSSLNGRNSSFTNTSAVTSNTITFGLTTPSIFNGVVAATNGPATGLNLIEVQQANLNAGGSLVNGTAGTTNTVTVGSANTVNVTGNLVIANGNAATSNNVNVDRLDTGGTKAGDVTISNGTPGLTSGASTVTFGALGLNTLDGNLTIRNQSTTGTKTTTIGGTTVGGTTGFYLFNVGTGNSVTGIGQSNPTTVTNLFKIQDGSGTANLEIRAATLGGLNFEDLGGGIDTINIGTTATGTATVNGVTRIVTNGGSDIVNIGTVAPGAVFNDSVFISLGAGNDTLNVGAFAASPAFSTAAKFQFDGGAGFDTGVISPLSIADYELPYPGKKLRFKITNFENLS